MKKAGSSKSISSPGRTDKFPPPLMRFLRSNVGNKSNRTRTTRASPMFLRKNKNPVVSETSQEPSSPKVTCIGQVRVRRSSKGSSRNSSTRRSISSVRKHQKQVTTQKSSCCCCNLHSPMDLLLAFKKLVCCFPFEHCGKKVDSSSQVESTRRVQSRRVSTSSSISNTTESIGNVVVVVTEDKESNPPKDALILTRCRSAPYRSSSLASRFWGSPLNHNTSPKSQSHSEPEEEGEPGKPLPPVHQKPILPEGENGDLESRKSHESEEMQSSISKEEEKYVHPLLLTRCKSEPARTGERLNPTRVSEMDSQS